MGIEKENIMELLQNTNYYRQLCFVCQHSSGSIYLRDLVKDSQLHRFILSAGEDVLMMNEEEISWLASPGFISSVVGHFLGGFIANNWGRRTGAMMIYPLFMSGFLFCGLSKLS